MKYGCTICKITRSNGKSNVNYKKRRKNRSKINYEGDNNKVDKSRIKEI